MRKFDCNSADLYSVKKCLTGIEIKDYRISQLIDLMTCMSEMTFSNPNLKKLFMIFPVTIFCWRLLVYRTFINGLTIYKEHAQSISYFFTLLVESSTSSVNDAKRPCLLSVSKRDQIFWFCLIIHSYLGRDSDRDYDPVKSPLPIV